MARVRLRGMVASGGIAAVAAVGSAGLILQPILTVGAAAAIALVLVVALRPLWTVYAALLLAVTTLPAFLPYGVPVGRFTVFLYEPFLYLAAVYVAWRFPPSPRAARLTGGLGLLVLSAGVLGIVLGNSRKLVVTEGRGLVTLTAAVLVAACLAGSRHMPALLTAIRWSLWVSAASTVLGSVARVPLNGRTDTASLSVAGAMQGSDALRLLSPGTQFGLAVLCACLALLLAGRASLRRLAPYLLPALVITFLGFSRNALLGVAVAVVIAVVADRSIRLLRGAARLVVLTAVLTAVIGVLALASPPLKGWIATEGHAFHDRVIVGLSTTVRSQDASALAREAENQYAVAAIGEAPLTGHGLGYEYRPATGEPGSFEATTGRYYVHNFYYWLLVKAGVLGLALWVLLVGVPLVRNILGSSSRGIAFAAAAAGLLAVCVVAPLPIEVSASSAVTMGIALGGLVARAPSPQEVRTMAGGRVAQLV